LNVKAVFCGQPVPPITLVAEVARPARKEEAYVGARTTPGFAFVQLRAAPGHRNRGHIRHNNLTPKVIMVPIPKIAVYLTESSLEDLSQGCVVFFFQPSGDARYCNHRHPHPRYREEVYQFVQELAGQPLLKKTTTHEINLQFACIKRWFHGE